MTPAAFRAHRAFPGILALVAILIGHAAGAGEGRDVLRRNLRLRLWGSSLVETAEAIRSQTGVAVGFSLQDFPERASARDVYLVTGRVELAAVLEGLARRYGFRYRVAETGRVEVSRGYGWAVDPIDRPALCLTRLEALSGEGDGDPAAARSFLAELFKPLPLLPEGYAVELENYPLPDNPDNLRIKAVLPGTLAQYLDAAVLCLLGDPGDRPDSPSRRAGLFAAAHDYPVEWEEFLSRQVPGFDGFDLPPVLERAADATRTVFVLGGPPARDGEARMRELAMGRPGLGQFTAILSGAWGLGRRTFLSCGAVVFSGGADEDGFDVETESRELFWGGLAVAGFDAAAAAKEMGGGGALTDAIRNEVFPSVWRDPVCALLFSQKTGRLAVIAPENVLPGVATIVSESR